MDIDLQILLALWESKLNFKQLKERNEKVYLWYESGLIDERILQEKN
jgi:hypothetical protein